MSGYEKKPFLPPFLDKKSASAALEDHEMETAMVEGKPVKPPSADKDGAQVIKHSFLNVSLVVLMSGVIVSSVGVIITAYLILADFEPGDEYM